MADKSEGGGAPNDVIERDRQRARQDSNPVPGTAENERVATRGEDAPDPVAEGKPQPTSGTAQPRR